MKIQSIRIENFRSFKDQTVSLDAYTCLVGPNGAGKSTVLAALNIFFRETENSTTDVLNLSEEDFHQKDTEKPVRITVTFGDLNADAQEDFKGYFRQGQLIVTAEAKFDRGSRKAEVKQFGQRLGMESFRPFFEAEAEGEKVTQLKKLYEGIRTTHSLLPAPGTKDAMVESLRDYEAKHPTECVPIPSADEFYGFSRGANRLAKYVQWVYIPAVKDVTTEQTEGKTTALGKLLARTVRLRLKFDEVLKDLRQKTEEAYQTILNDHQSALNDLGAALKARIIVWAHPGASLRLEWQKDAQAAVAIQPPNARTVAGEGAFEGDLARLGNGFQRSYLLAILQELATISGASAPTLILGCEEPELYQHPPQIRHLANVFEQLSGENTQVIVSTHHPSFVSGRDFESVRMIRFDPAQKHSACRHLSFDDFGKRFALARGENPLKTSGVSVTLHQVLQPSVSEMFFTKNLVLVEGLEDFAYISAWMVLTDRWANCRELGVHIVPANRKSQLVRLLVIAQGFDIPRYVVFDADGHVGEHHKPTHKKDNEALLSLLGVSKPDAFPTSTQITDDYAVWPHTLASSIDLEIPEMQRESFEDQARVVCGHAPDVGKNSIFVGEKLRLAFEAGIRPPSLEKLCEAIGRNASR